MNVMDRAFRERCAVVPAHGLGLSVDVYSPDLSSLLGSLQRRQVLPAYLEVFQAAPAALAAVKQRAGDVPLTYHGEGIWLTRSDAIDDPVFSRDVSEVAGQLRILNSAWSNHECATKQLAGYSFGTYLPPLYTPAGADVVAANARYVQARLDREVVLPHGASPLLLLEMPPLTYFSAGTISIAEFFRCVTEQAPCGLVLDMGHLWTVYRYGGAWKRRGLAQFVGEFLDAFPLERVIEMHVAGLAIHESDSAESMPDRKGHRLPAWTDAHMAPIPPVLFDLLDQVLDHPRLTALKGLALEVDTKPVDLIVEEFAIFQRRYGAVLPVQGAPVSTERAGPQLRVADLPMCEPAVRNEVQAGYDRYARIVSGRMDPAGEEWTGPYACLDELDRYRSVYLPHEILHWGGDVDAMFPATCRELAARAVALSRFVSFWFHAPRAIAGAYDFFLIKIERFVEFVHDVAPELDTVVSGEAEALRRAYAAANEPVASTMQEVR